jgi:hypothetical protein
MLFVLSDSSSIEVEGDSADLQELSRQIRDCEESCSVPLAIPAPFDERGLHYLKNLMIRLDSGSLNILEADQQLFISGAKDKLDLLSANIDWLVESQAANPSQKRDHLHIEFYPGHFFLSEAAMPVVIIRQDQVKTWGHP